MKTKDLILCALFAAVMSIFSVIAVPIGVISITLGVFGILLTAVVLGAKRGVISTLIFILLGAVGLPVFSGFKGGIGVLTGPSGGYILSYIPMALIVGAVSAHLDISKKSFVLRLLSCFAAVILCYLIGTLQYIFVMKGTSFTAALAVCVYPFIPFDIIKCILAVLLGERIKKRI